MKPKSNVNSGNTKLIVDKYTFGTDREGPRILFFGAIHGDEPCGTKALKKLVDQFSTGKLKVLKGSVTIVPVCNPKAFSEKVRYCEENLNRIFTYHPNPKTDEAKLANELASAVDQCDMLVDIHSTSARSAPFVFLDYESEANRQLVTATGMSNVLAGWIELYEKIGKSDSQKTSYDTGHYAHEKGKVSATIECGQHNSVSAFKAAYSSAINVLRHFGVIGGKTKKAPAQKVIRLDQIYYRDAVGDVLLKKWKNFEPVSSGQAIGRREGGTVVSAPYDGYVVMPKQNPKIGDEWFYFAKLE